MLGALIVTEEAWIHWNGGINSHSNRIWGAENPHKLHENPPHSQRLVFGAQCLDKKRGTKVGPKISKYTINADIIKLF
jgi:hypothetical protein